jgi:hypothetical protein
MSQRRIQGEGDPPWCSLDLSVEDEKETLHFGNPSTFEYVSLLPAKTEEKKLVIEDCLEELE